MVSMLTPSALDRVLFEPRSGHTKRYKIGICCFSITCPAIRIKSKDGFALCLSVGIHVDLPVDCYFNEQFRCRNGESLRHIERKLSLPIKSIAYSYKPIKIHT